MNENDDLLDDLFREARANPLQPSPAFLSRVLADAEAAVVAPRPVAAPRRAGIWTRLVSALGGAAAVAGMSSAAMAGLVIGYVQPEALVTLADSYGLSTSTDSLDLLPGYGSLMSEE